MASGRVPNTNIIFFMYENTYVFAISCNDFAACMQEVSPTGIHIDNPREQDDGKSAAIRRERPTLLAHRRQENSASRRLHINVYNPRLPDFSPFMLDSTHDFTGTGLPHDGQKIPRRPEKG